MAHHKSAIKRIRQTETRTKRNKAALSKVKTLIKKVYSSEDKETAEKNLKAAVSALDKESAKGRIHKNNASRKKAALTKHVNKLAAKAE
ncbi:30S ribosomal protein S20 [Melioribacter sp. Ez-97]|jgi:small subunit ribosomal protein S20|uniref:30S ribosomal protein S20 n=1 Tax=unclassified Melioribacter TaxID=2627329 RepID=UPI003BBECF4E